MKHWQMILFFTVLAILVAADSLLALETASVTKTHSYFRGSA